MKLFVGICLISCLIQISVQQEYFNSHRWGLFRSVGGKRDNYFDKMKVDSGSPAPNAPAGPTDGSDGPADQSEPAQAEKKQPIAASTRLVKIQRLVAKESPQTIRKPLSVKFVLKCGAGNVEKEEQVFIPAGKRLPAKIQRILDPTDGYITVVYRDYKGSLTRIEKLRLPEHLPKETIPAGGLVINRAELPWEPSINPVEFEPEEIVNNAPPSNIENQNVNERPSSDPIKAAPEVRPEVRYDSPPQVQKLTRTYSTRKSLLRRQPSVRYYTQAGDINAPLRPKSSAD